jgi:ATP-dependent exoDNAse (exonuclease V) alpha subunit
VGEGDEILTCKLLRGDVLFGLLLIKIGKLAQVIFTQTPGQLPAAEAGLLPLLSELKIRSIPGT